MSSCLLALDSKSWIRIREVDGRCVVTLVYLGVATPQVERMLSRQLWWRTLLGQLRWRKTHVVDTYYPYATTSWPSQQGDPVASYRQ